LRPVDASKCVCGSSAVRSGSLQCSLRLSDSSWIWRKGKPGEEGEIERLGMEKERKDKERNGREGEKGEG